MHSPDLTTPVQAQVSRYTKDDDAKEVARDEKQVVTVLERSENAKENPIFERQVVTDDVTGSYRIITLAPGMRFRVGGKKTIKKQEPSN